MIQVFQYPHETLSQTSTPWNQADKIQGYDDIEKFEADMIKTMFGGCDVSCLQEKISVKRNTKSFNFFIEFNLINFYLQIMKISINREG